MSDMVVIAAGISLPEAYVLRGALHAEGIFAAIVGEHDFGNRLIRVMVRDADVSLAQEILHDMRRL